MPGIVKMLPIGARFGRLVTVEYVGLRRTPGRKNDLASWRCHCDCGRETIVPGNSLRTGNTKSCGCGRGDAAGMSATPTYNSWRAAISRCHDPQAAGYANYGGRGIKVCGRWRDSFVNFYADMGERPADKTLDRIDVNGHYEPGNCKWSTAIEQRANRRPMMCPSCKQRWAPDPEID